MQSGWESNKSQAELISFDRQETKYLVASYLMIPAIFSFHPAITD